MIAAHSQESLVLHVRFPSMTDAQQACDDLVKLGIPRSQMSLQLNDRCAACEWTRHPVDAQEGRFASRAQWIGGILGTGVGALVIGLAALHPGGLGETLGAQRAVQWGVALSWTMSGGILGSLLGALVYDFWQRGKLPPHDHLRLAATIPSGLSLQAATLLLRHHGETTPPPDDFPFDPEGL